MPELKNVPEETRRPARKTALTRNTKLVAKSTENDFVPYLKVFYASSHPSNATEPTKSLGPDKSAKSNPSPRQKLNLGAVFEQSFKNRHFIRLEAQKIVIWTVIGVFDDAEYEKHNENLAGVKECTGRDEAPCPENGAHEEH